jgi:hypothetical protein
MVTGNILVADDDTAIRTFLGQAVSPAGTTGNAAFIPLGSDPADFLSLGFEYRSEYEWFHNSLWGAGPQTRGGYWLQRIIPQADFRLGPHFRFYLSFSRSLKGDATAAPGQ